MFRCRLQSAGTDKGFRIRICATETAVEVHGLVAAALFENVSAEGHCGLCVEDAFLLEQLEGILVEDFRPKVTIVACIVSATEDMGEICCAIARNDRR